MQGSVLPSFLANSNLTQFYIIAFSKTCVKRPLSKRLKIDFQDQLRLNAGRKYCRMLQGEHSALLSTFIRLPWALRLSILEWLFYASFTVVE